MSARYEAGAVHIDTGWLGYYQLAHRPERRYVSIGGLRVVFATEQEAKDEAHNRFIAALNRSLVGGVIAVVSAHKPTAQAAAEKLFRNGRTIQVERASACQS